MFRTDEGAPGVEVQSTIQRFRVDDEIDFQKLVKYIESFMCLAKETVLGTAKVIAESVSILATAAEDAAKVKKALRKDDIV